MRDFKTVEAAMPELVGKLGEMQASLSGDEQTVFAEMIAMAVSQAEELHDQRAGEVVGGALLNSSIFAKPISAVASLNDLRTITQLRSFSQFLR